MSKFERNEKARWRYVSEKPRISTERARIWTESYKKTEGQPAAIRAAKAFRDTCRQIGCYIFEDELIVGAVGEHFKCGILTPELSWLWVDREMDTFSDRPQDPYIMTPKQCAYMREHIFPYWKGKSLEEAFLARIPAETAKICVDTRALRTAIPSGGRQWGRPRPTTRISSFPRDSAALKRRRKNVWRLWTFPRRKDRRSGISIAPSSSPATALSPWHDGMRRPPRTAAEGEENPRRREELLKNQRYLHAGS